MKYFSFFSQFLNQYTHFFKKINLYWKTYGKLGSLIGSPYFGISIVITIFTYKYLSNWNKLIISIIPNVLGFTLGGYAILLAFGERDFLKTLLRKTENGEKHSYFFELTTAFVHFIIVQIIALLLAIISNVYVNGVIKFLGVFLLYYSLLTALAAAFAVFGMTRVLEVFLNQKNK